MKTWIGYLLLASVGTVDGCTAPTLNCQTQTCTGSQGKTYQLCANTDASETWNFGGTSCRAGASDAAQVQVCTGQLQAYCSGDGGVSGTSGGTSGSTSGGGTTPCSYTVSGAQTGSGTCSVQAAYDPGKSGGLAFTVTGGMAFTFGATLTSLTTPAPGTYTDADAAPGFGSDYLVGLTGVYVMCSTAQNCTDAKGNSMPPQGSFSLTLTSSGTSLSANGATLWSAPQGTLTATLPAQPKGSESGTVVVTVTL